MTLARCLDLAKIGKTEKAFLKAQAKEKIEDGYSKDEAERSVVEDMIANLAAERDSIVGQVGGVSELKKSKAEEAEYRNLLMPKAKAYRAEERPGQEANVRAVKDAIADVKKERKDIVSQIKKQLPEHFVEPVKDPWEMPKKEFEGLVRTPKTGYELSGYEKGYGFSGKWDDSKAQELFINKLNKSQKKRLDEYSKVEIDVGKKKPQISYNYHQGFINQAIAEGKPIPPEVLKDYPELTKGETEVASGKAIADYKGKTFATLTNTKTGDIFKLSFRPDSSSVGTYSVVTKNKEGRSFSDRMKYKAGMPIGEAIKAYQGYLNIDNGDTYQVKGVVETLSKPKKTLSKDEAELKRLEAIKYKTAGVEKSIQTLKKQMEADPAKWNLGDGVGWRVANQINRGYQVVRVDKEKKLALIKPVADTGLTVTGGGMEGIGEEWVHVADLIRDKKYNKGGARKETEKGKKRTKAQQNSINRIESALSMIDEESVKEIKRESQQRRKWIDKAWASIRTHAYKLGLDVPKRSTFYTPEVDVENAKILRRVFDEYIGLAEYPEKDSAVYHNTKEAKEEKEEKGETRFSVAPTLNRAKATEKDLVTYHNTTERELLSALESGGLAMPSMAITRKDIPFEKYGEITLVGRKGIVDPKSDSANRVFDSDVYSPRVPGKIWNVNEKEANDVFTRFEEVMAETGEYKWSFQQEYEKGKEQFVDYADTSSALKVAFLRERGIQVQIPRRPVPLQVDFSGAPAVTKYFKSLAKSVDSLGFQSEEHKRLSEAVEHGIIEYVKGKGLSGEKAEGLVSSYKEIYFTEQGDLKPHYSRPLREDQKTLKEKSVEIVTEKLRDRIKRKFTKKLSGQYLEWVHEIAGPMYGEPFVVIGKKKHPYTLDNIVTAMKREGIKGGEKTAVFGYGKARAKAAKKIPSIKGMHKLKGRLVTEEEFAVAKAKQKKVGESFQQEIITKYRHKDWRGFPEVWEALNDSMRATASFLSGKDQSVTSMQNTLERYGFDNVSTELALKGIDFAEVLIGTPTQYFEAKLQRAVGFNEFEGVVIPSNASRKLKDALKKAGLVTKTYKQGDSASRQEVTESFHERAGVLFREAPAVAFNRKDIKGLQETAATVKAIFNKVLPVEALKRIQVELKPLIDLKGKNLDKTLMEHGGEINVSKILGATTIKNMTATVELAYNHDNDTIEKTSYHEIYHISKRWLLDRETGEQMAKAFGNNEETEAEAFADYAMDRKGYKPPNSTIQKMFLKLSRILKRLRNVFQGKGFGDVEAVFGKLYSGAYEMQQVDDLVGKAEAEDKKGALTQTGTKPVAQGVTFLRPSPEEEAREYLEQYLKKRPSAEKTLRKPKDKKKAEKFDKGISNDIAGMAKGFLADANRGQVKKGRPDFKVIGNIIQSPEFQFKKIPAAGRVLDHSIKRREIAYGLQTRMLEFSEAKELMQPLEVLEKVAPEEHSKLMAFAINSKEELNLQTLKKAGFSFEAREAWHSWNRSKRMDTLFQEGDVLLEPFRELKKKHRLEYKKLQKAIYEADISRKSLTPKILKESGFSDIAVKAWIGRGEQINRGLDMLIGEVRAEIINYERIGEKPPPIVRTVEGVKHKISLHEAIKEMGDARDYYSPRNRISGKNKVFISRKDGNDILFFSDMPQTALKRYVSVKYPSAKGWGIPQITKSTAMVEDVFEDAQKMMNTEQIVNASLEAVRKQTDAKLDDFKIETEWGKATSGEKEFVLTSPFNKLHNEIFRKNGGKYFEDKWHFKSPAEDIESKLLQEIARVDRSYLDAQRAFAGVLAENIASTFEARGFLRHKIGRSEAVGQEVVVGYEKDPITNSVQYIMGIAGGTAKKITATRMMKAFTGIDVAWEQFKKEDENAKYDDWLAMTRKRRISASEQKNAFAAVKKYIIENLRNEEATDRALGFLQSLAVVKYLGLRIPSAAVNLTVLATSLPATMHSEAGIPLLKTYGNIYKATTGYKTYLFGDKSKLPKWQVEMYDAIRAKNWHSAQFNKEALGEMQSSLGRKYTTLTEFMMYMFGVTEQLNRVASIAGTYMALNKGGPINTEQLELAHKVSNLANGIYGKETKPVAAQGKSFAAQTFKLFYVFSKFSHTYLQNMFKMALRGQKALQEKDMVMAKRKLKSLSYMMFAPAILGGATAIPGWSVLMGILEKVFGGDDPEETLYKMLEDNFGETVENIVRHGLPGAGEHGVTIKYSLAIDMTEIPTKVLELGGAPVSVGVDIWKGIDELSQGHYGKFMEYATPSATGRLFKAYREATEGVRTRTGSKVFVGREQIKADPIDTFFTALGWSTTRVAKLKTKRWHKMKLLAKYSRMRQAISEEYKDFMTLPWNKRTRSKRDKIEKLKKEYNKRVLLKGLKGKVPEITDKWLDRAWKRANNPTAADVRWAD